MWLWILAALTIIITVLSVARSAFRRGVREELIRYLKEHRPSWTLLKELPAALILKAEGVDEIRFNLQNLYLRAAGIPDSNPHNRLPVYEQSLAALEEGLALQHPSMEKHGDKLLPRLVQSSFLAAIPQLVRRGLQGTPLHVAYVFNGQHGVSYLTQDHLKDLGLTAEEVDARALQNLRALVAEDMVRGALKGNLNVVKTGDTFDAARLLVIPSLLKDGEEVAAAVSDRDTLAVAPVPADGNWSALHQLARKNVGPMLLDVPLRVTKDGFETVR